MGKGTLRWDCAAIKFIRYLGWLTNHSQNPRLERSRVRLWGCSHEGLQRFQWVVTSLGNFRILEGP